MTDLFDTSGVPDDDAHWQALAERVAAHAIAANGRGRFAVPAALWVGASLAFAASLLVMLLSGRPAAPRDEAALRLAIAPADDVGRALTLQDAPPTIGALVIGRAAEEAP